ncbi:hypothetical protein [Clostridium sp. CF012]|uniref:DUF7168 domain-containing protein n=1 Tax=Clostridium sp. CF012 TaxID=2843319 RepID=UPI00209B62A5|nr:hypothetical protein [Clostridium sp. CF012]
MKVAMLKAQELLAKHKLSMQEVTSFKKYNSKIKDNVSSISFTKAKWKGKLTQLIAENFGCFNYYKTRRVNTITFFGREEDILVCNIALEYAVDCIENTIKRIQREYAKDGYSVKGVGNDYAMGFIVGLKENFEEQKKANQEWGLVLVKDKEVVEAYNQKTFKHSINTNTTFQGNTDIYYKGVEDGEKFSISNKISEGENEEVLGLEA